VAEQNGELVPVHLTEFARDPVFSFRNSNLKAWIAEKTQGAVKEEEVISISLQVIRQAGPQGVAALLLQARDKAFIIINAACYEDLEVVTLGIMLAEKRGQKFAYRCRPPLLKPAADSPINPCFP